MRRFPPGSLLTIILLIISSFQSYAQTAQAITGKVSTGTGDPTGGARIAVKNGIASTMSDFDGNFRISAPSNAILVFSYKLWRHCDFQNFDFQN